MLSNIRPKSVLRRDVPKNSDGAQSSKTIIIANIILFFEFFKIHDNAIDIIEIANERTVPYSQT